MQKTKTKNYSVKYVLRLYKYINFLS